MTPPNDTTATTEGVQPVSLSTMKKVMGELVGLSIKSDQWFVIDPEGRTYTGTIEQVAPVLLSRHPLLIYRPPPL